VLVLVLIDAETNANPSFSLCVALGAFGVVWRGVLWPKFEAFLRSERDFGPATAYIAHSAGWV